MPTAEASLLLPPPPNDDEAHEAHEAHQAHQAYEAFEEGSSRSLDQVGVEAVLEAMIVQRATRAQSSHNLRQSAPSFAEPAEIDPEALQDDEEEDEITSPDTFAARERAVRTSEVFLKVR